MAENFFTIKFCGGAGSVTGANFLLTLAGQTKFLVDCGLLQGSRVAEKTNRQPFPYNPAEVDALFVTHAHLDHIGRIPLLVKNGFRGAIYSTLPTKELAELSLTDSLGVLAKEAQAGGEPPLYEEVDVRQALSQWQALEYHEWLERGPAKIRALDAGHILGSAMFEFAYAGKRIVFTGDLGNSPSLLLPDTEPIKGVDYLVMESVYGDRNHESRELARGKLEDVIENTMRRRGTLLIPAFSIERTQELLYEIEQMMEYSRIPLVPVFLDSPLAIKVTGLYKKFSRFLKPGLEREQLAKDGIFHFPQLHSTLTTEESKAIAGWAGPKIIIAGSGMSNGGRIIHHEKRYLSDPTTALLLVGYQAAGSLGRRLQDGEKQITILGERVPVRAKVASLSGYSAHKGSDELVDFVAQSVNSLKQVWVTLGEPKSSLYLVQRLRDYLGVNAGSPEAGQEVKISF